MRDPERTDLINYRLEQARRELNTSVLLLNADEFKKSAVCSYYCIFHAMRAVLAGEGFDSKKHSGVIAAFRERYVKTNIFPAELSGIIREAFAARGRSDYEDFYVISKEEVVKQLENAKTFLATVEAYIKTL